MGLTILAWVFIVVGALFLVVLTPGFVAAWAQFRRWRPCSATITAVEPVGDDLYCPLYAFSIDGAAFTGRSTVRAMSFRSLQPGQPIAIRFDPEDPGRNDIESDMRGLAPIGCAVLGLVFIACGMFALRYPQGVELF